MAWLVSQRSFPALLHEKNTLKATPTERLLTNFQSPPYVLSICSNHPLSLELVPKSRLAHGLCVLCGLGGVGAGGRGVGGLSRGIMSSVLGPMSPIHSYPH